MNILRKKCHKTHYFSTITQPFFYLQQAETFPSGNASRAESETSRGAPAWAEGANNTRVQEQMNSFEFLVKS